jgi:hypothetical protein
MEVDSLADPPPASPAAAAPFLAASRRSRRSIGKITYTDELADDEEEEEEELAEGGEKPQPKKKACKSATSKVDVKGKGREVPPKDDEKDVSSTAHFQTSMVTLQKGYARQRVGRSRLSCCFHFLISDHIWPLETAEVDPVCPAPRGRAGGESAPISTDNSSPLPL